MPAIRIEDLLAQREWVGRVARTLVHGDAEAEDLEQRTWVRVLEHPPAEAPLSPRGWLRTLLRFAAIDSIRGKAARRRHEAAAAVRDRTDRSPDALVARAEILERVVHAVLALEEPYKGTILLRFFEDHPPREIARLQRIPVETVRTRIRRALDRLRKDLGGDGGREGLLAVLAPLLRPEGQTASAGTAGGIVMGTAAKTAWAAAGVAVLAAGGVVAVRWSRGHGSEPPLPAPAAAVVPVARPAPVPPAAGPEEAPSRGPPEAATEGAPVKGPDPGGPSIEERLGARPEEIVYDNATVGSALADLAVRLGLEPEYESEGLRQACFDTPFAVRFRTVPVRDVLTMAVRTVPSPVEGKSLAWEVRKDRLFILLGDPPPPRKATPEEEKKRAEKENALLERIRSEKTSFSFDGQDLMECCQYLSSRHGMNIVTEDRIRERAKVLTVKLTLREVPLAEALDELLRCDPELAWEVKGSLVLIRGK